MRNILISHVAAAGLLLCSGAALAHTGANSANHPSRRGVPNASITPLQRAQANTAALHGIPVTELAPNAPQRYTIQRGDTLWRIAGQYLKKPGRWPALWGMNRAQIPNPHWILPGQVLVLTSKNGRSTLRLLQSTAPKHQYLYAADPGDGSVSAYRINATTGGLTEIPGSPFKAGNNPISVTTNPAGTFAYVANVDDSTISVYRIHATTGALTPVLGSPFVAGRYPQSVAVNPAGTFAYVANFGDGPSKGTISAYQINAATGALTPVQGSPFATGNALVSVTVVQP
ncbi:exported hypothetical protein [Thiomonas sp. X19]|uniref:beta-propeller fold lactonase family protein n=1 Tax=Thiomonas sp. X19 TaxID=1050370 RepID=UPI000B683B1E|nr:beta-propeller fold lactonase family protein [Thiomonas sp. X19]SCC93575.1 exported hypothetical protein [Thiomonas sp. X19]